MSIIQLPSYFCSVAEQGRYYLAEWRKLLGLSQEELAEKSGVAQGTISDMETDPERTRRSTTIGPLAEALGIERRELRMNPNERPIQQPPSKTPHEMTPDELWEGFDALYMGGELSEKDIIDRLVRLRIEMDKRGLK